MMISHFSDVPALPSTTERIAMVVLSSQSDVTAALQLATDAKQRGISMVSIQIRLVLTLNLVQTMDTFEIIITNLVSSFRFIWIPMAAPTNKHYIYKVYII